MRETVIRAKSFWGAKLTIDPVDFFGKFSEWLQAGGQQPTPDTCQK